MTAAKLRYRLVVITHGDDHHDVLDDTMRSFWDHVGAAVPPKETVLVWDGAVRAVTDDWWDTVIATDTPQGFCETAKAAWAEAARPGVDYVFWLEHDFEFLRPVNLYHVARSLDENPSLAQMSLLREPMAHEGESLAVGWKRRKLRGRAWMEQNVYWTTNPSLIPSWVPDEYGWADGPECEGKHTIGLRDDGLSFGVWGDGEPWVRHTGVRTGFGY